MLRAEVMKVLANNRSDGRQWAIYRKRVEPWKAFAAKEASTGSKMRSALCQHLVRLSMRIA